ncbi:MAG: hypothetical protein ABI885_18460 [Gammaproteobacteria bacterium]
MVHVRAGGDKRTSTGHEASIVRLRYCRGVSRDLRELPLLFFGHDRTCQIAAMIHFAE